MRSSKLVAALVVGLTALALATLVLTVLQSLTAIQPATVVVLALVVLSIAGASAVGARSRRWLSNPYW